MGDEGRKGTRVTGGATPFRTYLDEHPDARQVLRERLQSMPDYRSWLEQFNPGLLATLTNCGAG